MEANMKEAMETSDVVIGALAGVGVIVLVLVFFFVVRMVFLKKE